MLVLKPGLALFSIEGVFDNGKVNRYPGNHFGIKGYNPLDW
jgi:hypothetical protein